jgi:hypothetical protein
LLIRPPAAENRTANRILQELDTEVTATNGDGKTALMWADEGRQMKGGESLESAGGKE